MAAVHPTAEMVRMVCFPDPRFTRMTTPWALILTMATLGKAQTQETRNAHLRRTCHLLPCRFRISNPEARWDHPVPTDRTLIPVQVPQKGAGLLTPRDKDPRDHRTLSSKVFDPTKIDLLRDLEGHLGLMGVGDLPQAKAHQMAPLASMVTIDLDQAYRHNLEVPEDAVGPRPVIPTESRFRDRPTVSPPTTSLITIPLTDTEVALQPGTIEDHRRHLTCKDPDPAVLTEATTRSDLVLV